ncbi:MAG: glycerophosphodiester phosphodiesterase family protein [Anaeromyxobacteraceae bacterium]
MSSERRILVLGVAALLSSACASRTGSQPPEFPAGGLVSRSTPPPNPWSLQNVLEGVYDTSSRFGSSVVVHASQWGGLADGMKASVAILGYDHDGFAILQPGCFTDTTVSPAVTRLVLEGYWRYLDTAEPTPTSTGLVRLFVGPTSLIQYVCGAPAWNPVNGPGDPRPPPSERAFLTGATGNGTDVPGLPLEVTWNRPRKSRLNADGAKTFFVGVHHGACQTAMNCGISENTPETAIMATQLQGEYLEIDVRLTKDQVPVFFHLGLYPAVVQGTYCTGMVEDYTYAELVANCRLRNGEIIPRVVDMLAYIFTRTALPTYLDSKTTDVIVPVSQILKTLSETIVPCPTGVPPPGSPLGTRCLFPGSQPIAQRGFIGLPNQDSVTTYQNALAAGQLWSAQRCLIEEDVNEAISLCAAWMPRYTRGPMTADVLNAQQQGLFVGFWTINDAATMDAFMTNAVPNGFLTNFLGVANQRFEEVGVVPPYTPYRAGTP